MKILIVDDDPESRKLLRLFVESHGHGVIEASDGQEGLEKASQYKPEAIISDALMPKMDGFQFLMAVRHDETLSAIPFVFFTAIYTDDKEYELALSLGADALIVKPKKPEDFWKEFTEALEKHASSEEPDVKACPAEKEEERFRDYCRIVAAKLEEKVRELEMVIADHERTKTSLLESEERYRLLFKNNPHPMWVYDLDTLAFLAVNEAAVYQYGYSREEFFSMTIKDIRPPEDVPALVDKVSKVYEGFDTARIWRHRKKDGSIIEVEISSHTLNFNGRRAKLILAIDVTERRLLEQEIENAASEWRSTFDAMSDAILLMDLEGKIHRCNRAMADLVGKDFSEIIGRQCREIVHRTSIPIEMCPRELMKKTCKKEATVLQVGPRWFEVSVDPQFDGEGKLIGAVHIMTDITEQKHNQEQLSQSEQRYRNLVDDAQDVIFTLTKDGALASLNPAFETITGRSRAGSIGRNFTEFVYPEDLGLAMDNFLGVMRGESPPLYVLRILHKSGEYLYGEFLSKPNIQDGKIVGLSGIARDITERKRNEELLKKIALQQKAILSNIPDMAWLKDLESRFLAVNESFGRACGMMPDDLVGKTDLDIWPKDLAERYRSDDREVMESGKQKMVEEPLTDKEGKTVWIETSKTPIYDEKGNVIGTTGIARNITERKELEGALKAAVVQAEDEKARADSIIAAIGDGITIQDRDFRIVYQNQAYKKLLGDHVGELCYMAYEKREQQCEGCPVAVVFEDGEVHTVVRTVTTDKGILYAEITASPLRDSKGNFIAGIEVVHDITKRKKAEDVLKEEKNKAQNYLDVAGVMIVALDSGGRITLINKKGLEILGYEENEVINRDWIDLCILGNVRVKGVFNKLMAGDVRSVEYYENSIITKDGAERMLAFHNSVIRNESGDISGILFSGEDITERKRAKEALERYSHELAELNTASNTLMLITNLADIYQEVCNIIYTVFDLKMVWLGIIEEGSFEVKPVAYAGHEDGYLLSPGVTWDDSAIGMGPTGMAIKKHNTFKVNINDPIFMPWRLEAQKRGFVESVSVPLIYARDKCVGALNFYSDNPDYFTPDRMKLYRIFANQAAIAIENAQLVSGLEVEVNKRTQALEDTNSELQQLNKELYLSREEAEVASRSKTDFLANISHEFRTPLNSIMGFSDIIQQGMAGPVTERQKEFLNDISASGMHLLTLITDILDLSKIEAGKTVLEPETFPVKELIDGSLVMFKEKALKHHIKVTAEFDDTITDITADKRKVKQVMLNLLSNAFKFTPDGGTVRVAARRVPGDSGLGVSEEGFRDQGLGIGEENLIPGTQPPTPDGDFIEISVSDTGIGISKENQQRLFQPFQQIETSLTRKYAGTGLGLSLCRRFVELHGGRIWVESEPGKGSRFVFIIPMKQSTANSE